MNHKEQSMEMRKALFRGLTDLQKNEVCDICQISRQTLYKYCNEEKRDILLINYLKVKDAVNQVKNTKLV